MRVTAPPRLPRATVPPVIELDDPTIVDEIDRALARPPLLPPPIPAPSRRMRSPAPTQIVEPLPAPGARDAEPPARILDAESTGGRISGEVVSSAPLPPAVTWWAARRWIVVAMAGTAVIIGAMVGLAIGRSTRATAASARPDAAEPAAADRGGAPRAAITVEELPPRANAAISAEPPAEPALATAAPATEPASSDSLGTKPPRSRHRPARSSKASRALSYDPDALFLKRP